MGKGLKKFLAMVGVIGLASGMGALSCSADKADNKGASNIPNTGPTDKTANISTVPGKKGLSNLAVAGIIAGSVAIVGAFVLIVEKVLLNGDNSEN